MKNYRSFKVLGLIFPRFAWSLRCIVTIDDRLRRVGKVKFKFRAAAGGL